MMIGYAVNIDRYNPIHTTGKYFNKQYSTSVYSVYNDPENKNKLVIVIHIKSEISQM